MSQKFPVKIGQEVVVIAGGSKGKSGKITSINKGKLTVTVEEVNIRKKAVKPSEQYPEGGIIDFEGPIHVSNVMDKAKFDAKSKA